MGARITLLVALLVGGLIGAILLYHKDPGEPSILPKCAFLSSTGHPCPGCGGTRAMHALLHLRVGEAARFNPLVFVALGLFLVLGNVIAKGLLGPRYPLPNVAISAKLGWLLGACVLAFWAVRNTSVWPYPL